MGHNWTNGAHAEKWAILGKLGYTWKNGLNLQKIGHTWKKGSLLEVGYSWKKGLHLANCVTLRK